MRHEARNAAIAVKEWVHPQQAVVRRRRCDDGFCLSEVTVSFLKAFKKAGQSAGADWNMTPNGDVAAPELARNNAHSFFGLGFFDPEQIFG
jgi:hypothetical protein